MLDERRPPKAEVVVNALPWRLDAIAELALCDTPDVLDEIVDRFKISADEPASPRARARSVLLAVQNIATASGHALNLEKAARLISGEAQ